MGEDRHHENEHRDEAEQEQDENDEHGPEPRQAEALQPVRDRVQHIAERQRRGEGQQHAAQHPQRRDQHHEAAQPECNLSLETHETQTPLTRAH